MSYRLFFGSLALGLGGLVLLVVLALGIRLLTLETPGAPPRTKQPYYVVRRGDSLSTIAQKTGVPVEELRGLNPTVDPFALVPRRRLRLRPSAPLASASAGVPARREGPRERYYVVKPGDALSSIGDETRVPLSRLIELNRGIRPDSVVPGQRIKLRRPRPQVRLPRGLRSVLRSAASS